MQYSTMHAMLMLLFFAHAQFASSASDCFDQARIWVVGGFPFDSRKDSQNVTGLSDPPRRIKPCDMHFPRKPLTKLAMEDLGLNLT